MNQGVTPHSPHLEAHSQEALEVVDHGVALHGVDDQGVTMTQLDALLRDMPVLYTGSQAADTIIPNNEQDLPEPCQEQPVQWYVVAAWHTAWPDRPC
jgi:hypothetical protein